MYHFVEKFVLFSNFPVIHKALKIMNNSLRNSGYVILVHFKSTGTHLKLQIISNELPTEFGNAGTQVLLIANRIR